jgi:peptidoglycan/xylan/chitin deacetylase (PgdA/CDA1 family)
VSVRSILSEARRGALSSLYRRTVSLGDHGPIVSFTFDDFPRTAFTTGGSILERFGARGTYYTAYGLMNTKDELVQFCSEDIDALLEHGHELASHTYGHISCRSVSCQRFCEDVESGSRAIEEASGTNATNFAYPFGHLTLRTKQSLAQSVTSARSIFPGFNGPEIDLNLLRANSLYGGMENVEAAHELIAENAKRKTWLIFYTHDVSPRPSPFGCTPKLLEAVVSCAAQSGSRILTVREALTEAGIQNGNPNGHVRQPVSV